MADPTVIQNIKKAAAAAGADPVAMLADSLVENGARNALTPGDVASGHASYGPFQLRSQVGALGTHSPQWALSPAAYANRAQEFARLGVHGGKGAAAVQRPADPTGYAAKVQGELGQARQLLGTAAPAKAPSLQPQSTAPITLGSQPSNVDHVGNSLIQSILDSNAKLAGISSITLPTATPIAPRVTPAPVHVAPNAVGTGTVDKTGASIVEVARRYLGTPYLWGGSNPKTGFDCSGLLQWAAAKSGIQIPRTSQQQFKAGKTVAPNQLRAGDAVFFEAGKTGPGHVGIYVGGGKFVESPHTGAVVRISSLAGRTDFVGARRFA